MTGLEQREIVCPLPGPSLMSCDKIQAERADEIGREALPLGDIPRQLRRIHRLLRREVLVFAPVVPGPKRQQCQDRRTQANPPCAFANFKFVNPFLQLHHRATSNSRSRVWSSLFLGRAARPAASKAL